MGNKSFIFKFADVEVSEREFSLTRAGQAQSVEPKAFRVLLMLLRNPRKLITKEELLNSIWGDAAVTDNSLTRAIALLRRLLDDDARSPRFIETVATVGYRWLSEVEQVEDTKAPAGTGWSNETSPAAEVEDAPDPPSRSRAPETARWPTPQWIWIIVTALVAAVLSGFAVARFRTSPSDRPRFKAQLSEPGAEGAQFEISPDGKLLRFAVCEAFTCKISVRPLGSLESQAIGDGLPAGWSPDSKFFISFGSTGKLFKNSPQGGPPVYLADAPPGYLDAAWLDTGAIVIAAGNALFSIPEPGRAATKISDQAAYSIGWLPGDRFLYSNTRGVFASSLRAGKPVQVLPDIVSATYVPSARTASRGHLVFLRAGTLLAQEFDLDQLKVVGDPIHVVPSGSDPGGNYIGSVSASRNGVLAFSAGDDNHVALTWFDRSGKKLQTVSQPFELGDNPTNRLSPDDTKAIVLVGDPNAPTDLWIADLERGSLTRFTFDGATGGIWSPDGTRMIWDDLDHHIYRKSADGSGKSELLTANPNCASCLMYDWSQDGKLFSFASFEGNKARIWLASVDGDRKPYPFREGSFNDFYGMFSPDHNWLAYTSDESGQNEIYIESIPSGRRRLQVSAEGGNWPIWRRDGAELFYRQGNNVMVVPVHESGSDLQVGKPQKLFSTPIETRFMVARDGQRFLIALPLETVPSSPLITIDTDWRAGLPQPR